MSHQPLPDGPILPKIKDEDPESYTELSDQGSEVSDCLQGPEETLSSEESTRSDSDDDCFYSYYKGEHFTGRDKITKWKRFKICLQVQNILTEGSGTRGNGIGVTTLIQAWNLFITEDIIRKVVLHTNEFIQKKEAAYSRPRDCKPTDAEEIRALFGLLYIAGTLRMAHGNLEDLYATDGTGVPIFPTTMPLKRIKFLLNSLRFDDATTRESRRTLDKAAPIRDIFVMFTQACLLPYSVGENVVIDEMITGFRGKCPFRQYIKSNPDNYGIKFYSLVDATTFYVLNIELYAGEQPEGPYQLSNAPADVVKRLITPISGTGRNLTISDRYNSVSLVYELAQNNKISVVGTIRKDDKEIPPCFTDKERPKYSSQFGCSDRALVVSYVPKERKSVILISSRHTVPEIDQSTNEKRKPSILTFYDKTEGVVNEVDKQVKMYSTSRKNNRWPLTLFFRLLDIAGINALVILRANGVVIQERRKYLRELGIELTKEYVQRRATIENLPKKLKRNIREHLNMSDQDPGDEPSSNSSTCRGSCKICPAKKKEAIEDAMHIM